MRKRSTPFIKVEKQPSIQNPNHNTPYPDKKNTAFNYTVSQQKLIYYIHYYFKLPNKAY